MSDTILTLDQLEELFYDLTVSMIGGSPDVRRSWPTGGAPAWNVTDNIVFIKIYDVPSSLTIQEDSEYSQIANPSDVDFQDRDVDFPNINVLGNMEVKYTRTLTVNWIFYGAQSWDNATAIRHKIYRQEFHDTLAMQYIYLVSNFNPPKRVPELWGAEWYERVDLNMNFNEGIMINYELPSILKVPMVFTKPSGEIINTTIEE
jgi:hypothetical protein